MFQLLMVGVGGAVGAMARYGVSRWLVRPHPGAFPFGTLTVNVVGCLLIGVLLTLYADRPGLDERTRALVVIGGLGSFTTFSTFGYESVELARHGAWTSALANVGLNLVLGFLAVIAARMAVLRLID